MAVPDRSPAPSDERELALNPFAVSRVGLAKLDYFEQTPGFISSVVSRVRECGGRGQVVGPHGSGKTTLTIALARQLVPQFDQFSWLVVSPPRWWASRPTYRVQLAARVVPGTLSAGLEFLEFELPEGTGKLLPRLRSSGPRECLFIDGVEQLNRCWQRLVARAAAHRPIIWTAHQALDWGGEVLCELRPEVANFQRVVEHLTGGSGELSSADVELAFRDSEGDLRQALGQLYDRWEMARSRASG